MIGARLRVALTALAVLSAIGCGPNSPSQASESPRDIADYLTTPLVEYSSAGGLAGLREELKIFPDGRAEGYDRDGRPVETYLPPAIMAELRRELGSAAFSHRSRYLGEDVPVESLIYRPDGRTKSPPPREDPSGLAYVQMLLSRLEHLVIYRTPERPGTVLELTVARDGRADLARIAVGSSKASFPQRTRVGRTVTLETQDFKRLSHLVAEASFPPRAHKPEWINRTDLYQVVHWFLVAEAETRETLLLPQALIQQLEAVSRQVAATSGPR